MHILRDVNFYNKIKLGKKEIQGRFVIPSGIRCAGAAAVEKYFGIESVGIITTKSISMEPKIGYKEPLYAEYGKRSYINAVGLENPGAVAFRKELSKIKIPENKFLLISIFGSDAESFYKAAENLVDYADGFELNMSCPHAKGYGLQIGSDIGLVAEITEKIAGNFDIPVFVKLSATVPNAAKAAGVAVLNGAAGITVSNTVGPGINYISGIPVLSNKAGGLSGDAIRPLGLKALLDIRGEIGKSPVIIGMGGIFTREHVENYYTAGADFFGIGSALTNLNTEEAEVYLNELQTDIIKKQDDYVLKNIENMRYQRCVMEKNDALTDALHKIKISKWEDYEKNKNTAGKFYFLMIPGKGEKPFALFSYETREFIIKNVGCFTKEITSLEPGDEIFIRGPYGKDLIDFDGKVINFVAGGTGISPVYEIAKKYSGNNEIRFFFGGKTAGDIFETEKYEKLGKVETATEDGSAGIKGYVTDIIKTRSFDSSKEQIFINVGPKMMIQRCYEIERGITSDDNIWASVEYHTSCGVGICGKCSTEKGLLSCVDGPFLKISDMGIFHS